jgi:hypothetical protein
VLDERYWYLEPNKFSESFIATKEQVNSLKEEYTNEIKKIIETVTQNSFASIHKDHEGCKYQHLG